MPEGSWINLAIQIPIVVLFAYVMLKMQDTFLNHLKASDERAKTFITEQRLESNAALKDLTDRMCQQFDSVDKRLDALMLLDVAHDAFVRTSFLERFGKPTTDRAEQAAREAVANIKE